MAEYRWINDAPIEEVVMENRWTALRASFRTSLANAKIAAPNPPVAGKPLAPTEADRTKWNHRVGEAERVEAQMNFDPKCKHLAYIFMGSAAGLMQLDVVTDRGAYIRDFTTFPPGTGAGDALMEWAVNLGATETWGAPAVSLMAYAGAVPRYKALGFTAPRGEQGDTIPMVLKPATRPDIWAQARGEWRIAAFIGEQYFVARGDPGFTTR
jgi:hypothetical protein